MPIEKYPDYDPIYRDTPDSIEVSDPIESILKQISGLNKRKRADYAKSDDIFSNFKESATAANLLHPGQSIEVMIATKQSRLTNLLDPNRVAKPQNESVEDSLLDRAVYAVIALAAYKEGLYG